MRCGGRCAEGAQNLKGDVGFEGLVKGLEGWEGRVGRGSNGGVTEGRRWRVAVPLLLVR